MDVIKWLELQLSDANFPVGAFTHSNGLEAANAAGLISGPGALKQGITELLHQLKASQVPYLVEIYRKQLKFIEISQHCESTLLNHIANEASKAQGTNLLSATMKIFPEPAIKALYKECLQAEIPMHQAPAFAFITETLGLPLASCVDLYLFNALKSMYSAAVRLNLIGPIAAQQHLFELQEFTQTLGKDAEQLQLSDVHNNLPLADLTQAGHDRIYSRLFQS